MYRIRLENTVTHQIYEQQVEDLNNGDKLYYNFGINTVDLVDGEYILTLFDADGNVLAEDLLRIGDFNPDTIQYTKGENTFIAVQLDAKLGSKQAHIEDIETTIYPNNGFDGMTDVYVNAQPLFDNAYSDGYNSGYGVGLEESYPKGYEDGYGNGKTDGYNEGYNIGSAEGYPKGYEDGQEDVAKNARVLEITENGTYMSKFSTPIIPTLVTGVYDDGSEFYSYASISGSVFDTGIPAAQDSKIEFWWKNTDATHKTYAAIIGGQTYEGYIFKFAEFSTNEYRIEYGNYKVGKLFNYNFTYDMTSQWNHIIFSKKDGLYVNGEFICEVQGEKWAENEIIPNFWINAVYLEEVNNNANGSFGMIKINDVVIIPTSNGFQNVNTGELLKKVQGGNYTYTENIPKYGEGELYKTINVNVKPKINIQKAGIKLGYSTFTEVPEWFDFTNISDVKNMFSNCVRLQTISYIDTSNVTDMSYMFNGCTKLQTISYFDTSNVTNMSNMFAGCANLQTIPAFDTSNVNNMEYMLADCNSIQTIPPIDTSNVTTMYNMLYSFSGNKKLVSLPKFECGKVTNINRYFSYYADGLSSLTDVGGWENLKCDWNDNYGLRACPNFTYQSCINILNGLYDFVGNGESTTRTLKVNPNFLTTVGDEISIGTNKGWIITA